MLDKEDSESSAEEEDFVPPQRKHSPQKPKVDEQKLEKIDAKSPKKSKPSPQDQKYSPEENVVPFQEEQHYGAIGLELSMSGDQQIRFEGYGCVRINSRSPSKRSDSKPYTEDQRVSDFRLTHLQSRPAGTRIFSPETKTLYTNTT